MRFVRCSWSTPRVCRQERIKELTRRDDELSQRLVQNGLSAEVGPASPKHAGSAAASWSPASTAVLAPRPVPGTVKAVPVHASADKKRASGAVSHASAGGGISAKTARSTLSAHAPAPAVPGIQRLNSRSKPSGQQSASKHSARSGAGTDCSVEPKSESLHNELDAASKFVDAPAAPAATAHADAYDDDFS